MHWNIQIRVGNDESEYVALRDLNAQLLLSCHDLDGVRCRVEVVDKRMDDILRKLRVAGVYPSMDVMEVLSVLASGGSLMTIRTVVVKWLAERKKPTLLELTLPDGRSFKIDSQLTPAVQEQLISEAFKLAAEDQATAPDVKASVQVSDPEAEA